MRVSVVIPAYRAERTIRRAVDSVLAQTHPADEIIVIDDGSPDNLAEVVERTYGGRVILIRQPNGKTAKARNAGLDRATGDFVAFLDADDYWEPTKLEKQLAVFERHPEVGMVAGQFFEQMPGEERVAPARQKGDVVLLDRVVRTSGPGAFRLATVIWTGTVIIRRDVMATERFGSGLEPAEDRDYWVRIAAKCPSYLLSEPLATAVLEEGSISRSNIARDCRSMLAVVRRHRAMLGVRAARLWESHTLYRWAANDPHAVSALPRLAESFWLWPMPFRDVPGMQRFGRLKRMVVLVALATGLRK